MKTPGADHPITVTPVPGRVIVRAGDRVIAESDDALALAEASYPVVYYLPRADADMAQLTPSARTTTCPHKGEATYFSIPALGSRGRDAVWSYETPKAEVAAIAGHLAFYADRVAIEVISAP